MAPGADQKLGAPNVLLTGASSQIGVFAIPRLLQAGFHIFAVSRKGRPAWCPDHEQVEWVSGEDAERISGRCQYLLSAGPMALAAQLLQTGRQLKSAVVFSSSSVETKQQSGSAEERSQVQAMRALESAIRGEAVTRETKLVILRPTLIYGCGLDSNISRLAIWISRFGFIPVNGMAGGLRQPVHADDLASVAIAAMLSENSLPTVLTLSGGSTLSYKEMVSAIFVALGRPVRMFHLPERVLLGILRMAKIFGAGSGINGEMIKRQRTDLVFNNQQAQELLNYQPRPFAPAEEDFLMPDLDNFKT